MNHVFRTAILVAIAFLSYSCQPTQERTSVTIVTYGDSAGPGSEGEQAVWTLVREKTKSLTDLEVTHLDKETFDRTLEAAAAGGPIPDLILSGPSGRSPSVAGKGLLRDLGTLLDSEDLKEFSPAVRDLGDGSLDEFSSLPGTLTATHLMFVNTEVLDRVGLKPATTYEELRNQVPKLRAAGLEVVLMANKEDWVMGSCLFSALVGRFAGNSFVAAIRDRKARFTDPEFVRALKFVQNLYADGVLSRTSLQTGYGEIPSLFAAGKAAYLVDGDWRVGSFLTDPSTKTALIAPEVQKKIVLSVFPTVPGELPGAPQTSVTLGSGFGISRALEPGSARERAALEVLKVLESQDVQALRLERMGIPPSRTDVIVPALEPLAEARTQFVPGVTAAPSLERVLDPAVTDVLNAGLRKIGLGMARPEEVAAEVQKAFEGERGSS